MQRKMPGKKMLEKRRQRKKIVLKEKSYCGLNFIYKILPSALVLLVFQKLKIFWGLTPGS